MKKKVKIVIILRIKKTEISRLTRKGEKRRSLNI